MSSESDRNRRKTIVQGIFARISGTSASLRDRSSSVLSKLQKGMSGYQDHDCVRFREWLFAFTEFLLAFSWNCFLTREKSEQTLEIRNITPRQDTMETLFWIGFAALGNLAVGVLMDSYTGTYLMALFNVIMHFSLASFFLIGEVVNETSSEDVYAHLLSHVFLWSNPPIRASRFTRYVYCMDQVAGKGGAFIIHFTFIFNFLEILGNYLFNIVRDSTPSSALLAAIAFSFNGTCLFLFAYMLRPKPIPQLTPPAPAGVAIKVWNVAYTALKNRRKVRNIIRQQDWLDYAENKYDKVMILRTKRLFRVFLVASPTAGFLLFNSYQEVIFQTFYDNLKLSGADVPYYTKWFIYTSTILVVLAVEYIVLPAVRACKFKVNFMKRFLIGYLSLLFGVLMATLLSTFSEKINLRSSSGVLRVFNTMQDINVTFKSRELEFTDLNFIVEPRDAIRASFQAVDKTLFRMEVSFGHDHDAYATSYTQCFSVLPETVTQYVAIHPSIIMSVPTHLPIFEGPPGNNDRWKPRCFLVNFIKNEQTVLLVSDSDSRFTYNIKPGQVIVFQVPEGNYIFQYANSITHKARSTLKTGGLYGIYLFLSLNEFEIEVDKVIPENTQHALVGLAVSIPMSIARGIGQVALDAFVYTTAPDGLKGTAFGFYTWILHLNAWFLLIGFHTWHHYITPNALVIYSVVAATSFIFCLTLLIKFRNYYTM